MNEFSSNMKRQDRRMDKKSDFPPPPSFMGMGGPRRSPPVEEEGPSMRSVAIMGPPSPSFGGISGGMGSLKLAPPTMGFGGSMKLAPPSMGFGGLKGMGVGLPPKMGISRPSKLGGKSLSTESEGHRCTQEWDELIAVPSSWAVKTDDLELVPIDFPLERTHREIDGVDASEVSSRISMALRVLSIDAEYNEKKARAKCKTNDLVKFRIRLYAGSETGMPVVVEVQKRSGSTSSFMRSCREILKAAEGKAVSSSPRPKMGPPSFKKPMAAMDCLKDVKIQVSQDEVMSVLNSSLAMFRSKALDSNVLGLENLCSLTDPVKTSPVTALAVSKRIILDEEKNDAREDVFALLQRDVFVSEFNVEEMEVYAERMRHHALVLLSNTLEMCAKDGCLAVALQEQAWFEESLVPSLIDEVKSADFSATNAFQAVRCLQSIVSSNTQVRSAFESSGGIEAIKSAHEFALERNQLLAEETKRFMAVIKSI